MSKVAEKLNGMDAINFRRGLVLLLAEKLGHFEEYGAFKDDCVQCLVSYGKVSLDFAMMPDVDDPVISKAMTLIPECCDIACETQVAVLELRRKLWPEEGEQEEEPEEEAGVGEAFVDFASTVFQTIAGGAS